jgi:hypothetical protein
LLGRILPDLHRLLRQSLRQQPNTGVRHRCYKIRDAPPHVRGALLDGRAQCYPDPFDLCIQSIG